MLPAQKPRQIARLLLRGAPAAQLIHAQVRMRSVREPDRGARTADLLHRDDVFEVTQATAAVLRLVGDAEKSEGAQLRPQIARKGIRGVDLRGARGDELGGELAHGLAQQVDALAKLEIKFDHVTSVILTLMEARGARARRARGCAAP